MQVKEPLIYFKGKRHLFELCETLLNEKGDFRKPGFTKVRIRENSRNKSTRD